MLDAFYFVSPFDRYLGKKKKQEEEEGIKWKKWINIRTSVALALKSVSKGFKSRLHDKEDLSLTFWQKSEREVKELDNWRGRLDPPSRYSHLFQSRKL